MICGVGDERCLSLLRLFNEPEGAAYLARAGTDEATVRSLPLLGISGICNLVAAIKMARYYEFDRRDLLFIPLTDSSELYRSRLDAMRDAHGSLDRDRAARIYGRHLQGIATDHVHELTYRDRKRLHNLQYFTWVGQQGRRADELADLWDPSFWSELFSSAARWDAEIVRFNEEAALA